MAAAPAQCATTGQRSFLSRLTRLCECIFTFTFCQDFTVKSFMRKTVLPVHQARSRDSLSRLLKATVEVLDEDGIEGATIPRIAARAGVSPGTVYRRFPDKDALLREVCIRAFESNYKGIKELFAAEHWEGKSLEEVARKAIDLTLKG